MNKKPILSKSKSKSIRYLSLKIFKIDVAKRFETSVDYGQLTGRKGIERIEQRLENQEAFGNVWLIVEGYKEKIDDLMFLPQKLAMMLDQVTEKKWLFEFEQVETEQKGCSERHFRWAVISLGPLVAFSVNVANDSLQRLRL